MAITTIQNQQGKLIQNDLVIQPYKLKYDPSKSFMLKDSFPIQPEYGKVIWKITPQQLPVSDHTCIMEDADLCKAHDASYKSGMCVHSCIVGGAEILAYDKNTDKLYLYAHSTTMGTGGGPFFLFVADIKTKKIKFIKTEYGPFEGELSPDGKILLMYGWNTIAIYNILTTKEVFISEENDWDYPHQRLHYMGTIKWLSNSQFTYQVGVRHSKFQPSFDEMKENTYDIPSGKIIASRVMTKNEYDNTPFVDD